MPLRFVFVTATAVDSHSRNSAALPDGLVVVVKADCETCRMVAPLLADLAERGDVTVYTQDDPAFPTGVQAVNDLDLGISWHHDIETVPTLIRMVDGREVERTVGWSRADWQRITGDSRLGAHLPATRPGCGSLSVDPDLVDELVEGNDDPGPLRRAYGLATARQRHHLDDGNLNPVALVPECLRRREQARNRSVMVCSP
jgi:thiol-disulfide isomerase/thioredoxin